MKPDFNLYDCYAVFDVRREGFVSRFQFEEVFTLNELYPSTWELSMILRHYNSDGDGVL